MRTPAGGALAILRLALAAAGYGQYARERQIRQESVGSHV